MSIRNSAVRHATAAIVAASFLAVGACGDDDSSTSSSGGPSCAELKTQVDACTTIKQETKDAFLATCAEPRFTASCRSCLNGKLCGVTEDCDRLCGK